MKKIVILGCENSHANSFLNFMKEYPKYADVEVIGVYSDDAAAMATLKEKYGVHVMESYDEAVGCVDGVIITARHGKNHYKYAKPYIASGVPMFIDKPITIDGVEAVTFMRECKAAGVRITGGSCCKHADAVKELKADFLAQADGATLGGVVRAPMNLNNEYGGFYFYSQHLVEMLAEIFGRFPESVKAYKVGTTINASFKYPEFVVTAVFVDGNYIYSVERIAAERSKLLVADIGKDCFLREFDEFYEILSGDEQRISYKDFISPVFMLNAIEESLKCGKEIAIKEYEI